MLDEFYDERSWIDSLNISPKHLKKTDAGWNGYENPRPPSDPPNGPFGGGVSFGPRFG